MAMSEEELMALEREGYLLARKVVDGFRAITVLCAGEEDGAIAVLSGYMSIYLSEMPELSIEDAVRMLCAQFAPRRAHSWPDKIIARLRGVKGGAPS